MLKLSGVAKAYGATTVVSGVNLEVEAGQFFSLLGPSGCGKTTILRMIAGIIQPDAGSIHLAGTDVTHVPINKRDLALVFQSYALFPHMTVADNVAFGLRMRGVPRPEILKRVTAALELVHLPGMETRMPAQLSGGQQQRVALARAIVVEPRLLLLDEPLSNLDAGLREQMRWYLKQVQQKTGITTVLVTHDMQEAFALSDRIAVLRSGSIEQVGEPRQIYAQPKTTFVARFTGETNLVEGALLHEAGRPVFVTPGGVRFPLAQKAVASTQDTATLLIRPEAISVGPHQPELSQNGCSGRIALDAEILEVTYLGANFRVCLRVGDLTLISSVPGHTFDADPKPRTLLISSDDCLLMS